MSHHTPIHPLVILSMPVSSLSLGLTLPLLHRSHFYLLTVGMITDFPLGVCNGQILEEL